MPETSQPTPTIQTAEHITGRLGIIADKAVSYSHAGTLPGTTIQMQLDCLRTGLTEVAHDLRALVIDVTGNDPWRDSPPEAAP